MAQVEGGFPHSEIHGSKPVRGSPWLIAAYHVLHRLSAPRHPPDTLMTLDRSHYRWPSAGLTSDNGTDAWHRRATMPKTYASEPVRDGRRSSFPSSAEGPRSQGGVDPSGAGPHARLRLARVPDNRSAGHIHSSRCRTTRLEPKGRGEAPAGGAGGESLGADGATAKAPSEEAWWSKTGSNRRPHACKARALPTELLPRFG